MHLDRRRTNGDSGNLIVGDAHVACRCGTDRPPHQPCNRANVHVEFCPPECARALVCTLSLFVLFLLPDLNRFLPPIIRGRWVEYAVVVLLMAYAIAQRLATGDTAGTRYGAWARAGLKRLDHFADWALRGGLARRWACSASAFFWGGFLTT